MKYVEDSVREKQQSMKQWLTSELEARGYTRSHEFGDYFRACRELVGLASAKYRANKYRSAEAYKGTAAEVIMNYIDPWN